VGVEFTDLVVGSGSPAVLGNIAGVNYTGWLYNGDNLDGKGALVTSLQEGPFFLTIGSLQTIPGFEQGIVGMRVGGKRRVYIPSDLAYGPAGNPSAGIPPDAALVFEIELRSLVQ
jgi:FKBP-type peptidyl-prolyl cis-trans isomerase